MTGADNCGMVLPLLATIMLQSNLLLTITFLFRLSSISISFQSAVFCGVVIIAECWSYSICTKLLTIETGNFWVVHHIRLHWQRCIFLWAKAGMWDERFSLLLPPLTIIWAKAVWDVVCTRDSSACCCFWQDADCPDCSPGVRNLRTWVVDGQMVLCWCNGYDGSVGHAPGADIYVLLFFVVLENKGSGAGTCRATCTIDTLACAHIWSTPACTVNCCVLCRQLLPTFLSTRHLVLHGSRFQPCQISTTPSVLK